ncbi:MAG TPA: hypothetical protein VFE88_01475 [Candidatus Nanoarchaeia archaeon]|nr:hypothetical protein [Candidatus Nanoarchaeia archaeon]
MTTLPSPEDTLHRIRVAISKKEFESAINQYLDFEQNFKKLPEEQQKHLLKIMDLISKELESYLRINQAYLFAEQGDIQRLSEEMNRIRIIAFDISSSQPAEEDITIILNYIQRHYTFFQEIYHYKVVIQTFQKMRHGVSSAFNKHNFPLGLKKYAELWIAYNHLAEVVDQEKRHELYKIIRTLFKDVYLERLEHFAREKPTHIIFDLNLPTVTPTYRELHTQGTLSFDKKFKQLRRSLTKNNEQDALHLFQQLFVGEISKKEQKKKTASTHFEKVHPAFRHPQPEEKLFSSEFSKLRSLIRKEKVHEAEHLHKNLH